MAAIAWPDFLYGLWSSLGRVPMGEHLGLLLAFIFCVVMYPSSFYSVTFSSFPVVIKSIFSSLHGWNENKKLKDQFVKCINFIFVWCAKELQSRRHYIMDNNLMWSSVTRLYTIACMIGAFFIVLLSVGSLLGYRTLDQTVVSSIHSRITVR